MALPKPAKSKAAANVQPAGMYHADGGSRANDPCCIPDGVHSSPLLSVFGEVGTGDAGSAVAQILTPGGH